MTLMIIYLFVRCKECNGYRSRKLNIYMYVYIHVCVCMCVCVCGFMHMLINLCIFIIIKDSYCEV